MLLSRRLAEAAVRRVEEREARLQEELKQQEERRMRQVEDELRKVAAEQEKERSEAGKARRPSRFAVSSVPGEDSPGGLSIPPPSSVEGQALAELRERANTTGSPPAKIKEIKGILKHHKDSNFTIHGDPTADRGGSLGHSPYTTVTGAAR